MKTASKMFLVFINTYFRNRCRESLHYTNQLQLIIIDLPIALTQADVIINHQATSARGVAKTLYLFEPCCLCDFYCSIASPAAQECDASKA